MSKTAETCFAVLDQQTFLIFAVAVQGPILLGKTLHYGGGLFRHP